jgi:hypothetical protein
MLTPFRMSFSEAGCACKTLNNDTADRIITVMIERIMMIYIITGV